MNDSALPSVAPLGVVTATTYRSRQANLRNVLRLIASGDAQTRAELARATGLTRPTVSNLVAELVNERLVVEVGPGPAAIGKPPTLLQVDPSARQVVSVDLSSRPAVAELSDLGGRVVAEGNTKYADRTGPELLEDLYELVLRVAGKATAPIVGIGIGVPGLVPAPGVVRAANLRWWDLPLEQNLTDRSGLPAWVVNTTEAIALVEYGARVADRDALAAVRIGPGVGVRLMLDGQLYTGARAAAGEIGHLVVAPGGPECVQGHRGCLEAVASVPAIVRRAAAAAGVDAEGLPWDADLLRQRLGAPPIDEALTNAGEHWGAVLAHLVAMADIKEIVLSFELDGADDTLLTGIRRQLTERLPPEIAEQVHVRMSSHGHRAVLHGAHALVLGRALGMVRPENSPET